MANTQLQNNGMGQWLWLKILLSGIVMFFLIKHALVATGNILYVPSLIAVGTFTVPLAFVILLYTRDKMPHVSAGSLLTSVLWGGVLGTVLAGSLEYQTFLHLSALPTILIGLIEEIAKIIVPALFIVSRKHYSELDAIVIGAAAGAGFAALESMGYGLVALLLSGGDVNATVHTLLIRGLMAPAAHIAWTAILASALWRMVHGAYTNPVWHFIYAFFGVIMLHALWDTVAPFGIIIYVVLGALSLGWLLFRLCRNSFFGDIYNTIGTRHGKY